MVEVAEDVGRGCLVTLGAVAALGFGEACVRCRKPVPLRFALRFASYNVLPSLVWRSFDPHLLCEAAHLPSVSLHGPSLLAEALRAARYATASYGILHQLLQLHRPATQPAPAPTNRIVRLSPGASPLTDLALQKHSQELLLAIDWTSAPNHDVQIAMHQWCLQHASPLRDDLLLLEVDLSADFPDQAATNTAVHAMRSLLRPFRGEHAVARHMDALVIVLASPWAVPTVLDHDAVDIVVNTAAVVAEAVAGFVRRTGATRPLYVHSDSPAIVQGLLSTSITAVPFSTSADVLDGLHVIDEADGAACLQRLLDQGVSAADICWIQRDKVTAADVFVLHVPQLLDEELAVIRSQLRCGMPVDVVQNNVRDKYGPLNALVQATPFRQDRHSLVTAP
ncbi:hypothetical protein ACHHYP_12439 [Achlya hypogyna]|uniref:Uncharacterized protein n=1 Tax=Achlya hypogyna TaxID=1202772 RepID=A0A1V9YH66_ACHHY|nr:hypothetical protein ACHHYP_12439 [Achlya hypogyna]